MAQKIVKGLNAGFLPDGTEIFIAYWIYNYIMQTPISDVDYYDFGKSPAATGALSTYRISPTAFITSLVGPSSPVTTALTILPITY